jgi:hypothetical protein
MSLEQVPAPASLVVSCICPCGSSLPCNCGLGTIACVHCGTDRQGCEYFTELTGCVDPVCCEPREES